MQVVAAMVANRAEVANGLLNVSGGGWDSFTVHSLPATIPGFLCGVIEVQPEERGQQLVVHVEALDHEGHDAGSHASMVISTTLDDAPPWVTRLPFAMPFVFAASAPGEFTLRMVDDDGPLCAVSFPLVLRAPEAP